ncbi:MULTISPECIES: GNAT family N-acetyltransferase [Nocardia]|uniref:GNAT family N-acetyltransferase n=1 Tax=Nocardia TaxID=1817 RepID=UPI00130057CE|nr:MULTISPECIES: GNAT family N-acetyltransferase [Nocardia]
MNIAEDGPEGYRPAQLEDLRGIEWLEQSLFDDTTYQYTILRQLYAVSGKHWLVAELNGKMIGHALVLIGADKTLLASLAVAEDYQNKGIGRRLLGKALEACVDADVSVIELTVRPDNVRARRVFDQAGFTIVDKDDHYFGPDQARLVMECELAAREVSPRTLERRYSDFLSATSALSTHQGSVTV